MSTATAIMQLFPGLAPKPWKLVDLDEAYRGSQGLDMKHPTDQDRLLDLESDGGKVYTYGGFGEDRSNIWRGFEAKAQRMVHLGVDLNNLPEGQSVASPTSGVVVDVWNDPTPFNGWGGRIIVLSDSGLFFLFGHLEQPIRWREGDRLNLGEILGRIGGSSQNGGWFSHLHLQVMTSEFVDRFPNLKEIDGYDFSRDVHDIPGVKDPIQAIIAAFENHPKTDR